MPLVGMLCGQESRFLWTDAEGCSHTIVQGEGGEQGDPLMPALFALAQHDALVAAKADLRKGAGLLGRPVRDHHGGPPARTGDPSQ